MYKVQHHPLLIIDHIASKTKPELQRPHLPPTQDVDYHPPAMSMGEVGLHSLKKAAQIFPDEPPKNDGTINKHSALLTQDPSRGGVQAYMYALGLTKEDMNKAQICIASVWFEVS